MRRHKTRMAGCVAGGDSMTTANCTAINGAEHGVMWQVERVNARLDVVINNASYMDIVSTAQHIVWHHITNECAAAVLVLPPA